MNSEAQRGGQNFAGLGGGERRNKKSEINHKREDDEENEEEVKCYSNDKAGKRGSVTDEIYHKGSMSVITYRVCATAARPFRVLHLLSTPSTPQWRRTALTHRRYRAAAPGNQMGTAPRGLLPPTSKKRRCLGRGKDHP